MEALTFDLFLHLPEALLPGYIAVIDLPEHLAQHHQHPVRGRVGHAPPDMVDFVVHMSPQLLEFPGEVLGEGVEVGVGDGGGVGLGIHLWEDGPEMGGWEGGREEMGMDVVMLWCVRSGED